MKAVVAGRCAATRAVKQALALLLLTLLPSVLLAESIGGDFTLTDHHGKPFNLAAHRGKVVVMFFGFTNCPAICPDSLGKMANVTRRLEDAAADVTTLFITVDPDRDSVDVLSQYIPFFSPQMLGLTGTSAAIKQVADQYRVSYELNKSQEAGGYYTVDHTPDIYVLNREGRVASIVPYGMPAEHIFAVVKQVLGEHVESDQLKGEQLNDAEPEQDHAPKGQSLVLKNLKGEETALKNWRGRPLLINLWASWCTPCREELPALNNVWRQIEGRGIDMVALNVGEAPEAVTAFVQDYPIEFPVWLDESGQSMQSLQVEGLPTTLLLNSDGTVAWKVVGERQWDDPQMIETITSVIE